MLGYACLTQFGDRSVHRFTAEDGIYVCKDVRGRDLNPLAAHLSEAATRGGFRQRVVMIGDAAKIGSLGALASRGFRGAVTLRVAARKFSQ